MLLPLLLPQGTIPQLLLTFLKDFCKILCQFLCRLGHRRCQRHLRRSGCIGQHRLFDLRRFRDRLRRCCRYVFVGKYSRCVRCHRNRFFLCGRFCRLRRRSSAHGHRTHSTPAARCRICGLLILHIFHNSISPTSLISYIILKITRKIKSFFALFVLGVVIWSNLW